MIGKLGEDKKANWPSHLAEIVHTYNATWSTVTGYSPHYLMFRHRPRLLVNFVFPNIGSNEAPMREASAKHVDVYVASVWDRLRTALQEVQAQLMVEAHWQKWYYDRKIGAVNLKPGNLILVKGMLLRERGRSRIGGKRRLGRWLSDHDRCPLLRSDEPRWKVTSPPSKLCGPEDEDMLLQETGGKLEEPPKCHPGYWVK